MKKLSAIKLPSLWQTRWQIPDPFWHVFYLQGDIYRQQPARKTLKYIEENQGYFVKLHYGVGWREIFKNFLKLKWPILGAKNEYKAIKRLEKFGFTPMIIGYGWRGINPAKQQSFLITKELNYTVSLEDYCREWLIHPPKLTIKRALIKKIATIARLVHQHGVNHRDFYLCHFLLDVTGGRELFNLSTLTLYVIDWHRAQIRHRVSLRWCVKDIAGLYFSAMDIGLTKHDLLRFALIYNNGKHPRFWRQVIKRAQNLYRKSWRKLPRSHRLPFYLPLENHTILQAKRQIRTQPRKRMIIEGQWQGISVLAKVFTNPRHARAEIHGYHALKKHGFATPPLLHHGWSHQKALYVIVYTYLGNAQPVNIASLSALLALIKDQHAVGIYQRDLHFNNFLLSKNQLFTIDTASIKYQQKPLSQKKSEYYLALLFAQLSQKDDDLWRASASPALINAVSKWRNYRERKYLKKTLRTCTAYISHRTRCYFYVLSREHANLLSIENLLNLNIDQKLFSVQVFPHKTWDDYFVSPGRKAWLQLQKKYLEGQNVSKPIGLVEKTHFFIKTQSYLVTLR